MEDWGKHNLRTNGKICTNTRVKKIPLTGRNSTVQDIIQAVQSAIFIFLNFNLDLIIR